MRRWRTAVRPYIGLNIGATAGGDSRCNPPLALDQPHCYKGKISLVHSKLRGRSDRVAVPMDEGQRKLAQAHQIVVEALGRATTLYGLPVALGRTYALLYLADMPLSVTEVTVRLGITKGTASVNLRVLERMQMVRQVWQPRRRGKFFVAERDFHRTLVALMRTTMAAELEIIRTGLAQSDRLLKEIESSANSSSGAGGRLSVPPTAQSDGKVYPLYGLDTPTANQRLALAPSGQAKTAHRRDRLESLVHGWKRGVMQVSAGKPSLPNE